jgi:hypothetical protein
MSPERNVDIRHVSRENIRRDPSRLIAGAIWLVPSHKNRIKATLPNKRKAM